MTSSLTSDDPIIKVSTTLDALSSVPAPSQSTVKHSLLDPTTITTPPDKILSLGNILSSNVETITQNTNWSSLPSSPLFKAELDKNQALQAGFGGISNSNDTSLPLVGTQNSHLADIIINSHDLISHSASDTTGHINNTSLINGIVQANAKIGSLDPLQLEYSIDISEVVPVFDFVSKLKTAETNARLYELSEKYSHVRNFTKSQQSVFLALSFAFFEQFFLKGSQLGKSEELYPLLAKVLNQDIEISMGASKFAYIQLISDIKAFMQDGDLKKGSSLYESMCYSSGGYEATLIVFTEMLIESLKASNALIPSDLHATTIPAFRWMNDVPLTEEGFYQTISQILRASLTVIILTATQTGQKTFTSADLAITSLKDLPGVILLIDKRNGGSHLLYTSKEQRKSTGTPARILVKQPSTFNFLKTLQRKATNKLDSSMNLKTPTVRGDKRRVSVMMPGEDQNEAAETFTFSSESYQKKKQKEEFMVSLPPRENKDPAYITVSNEAMSLLANALKNINLETIGLEKPASTAASVATIKKEAVPIPMQLKDKFISYNIEVQKHESELKAITERYIQEKKEESEKKVKTERLIPVFKKYEEIIQQKQSVESIEELEGGGGMRMDS